jgi:MFS family permease
MYLVVAGWLLIVVALIGAAYSASIPTLIVNQGLLYGVGYMLLDNPSLLILNTWFLERRGLAYGILFAACDLWGVIWAFVAEASLDKLGLRITLWIFAATILVIPGLCLFYIQERGATGMWKRSPLSLPVDRDPVPPSTAAGASRTAPSKRVYASSPVFYLLTVANFLQAIGCEYACLPLR